MSQNQVSPVAEVAFISPGREATPNIGFTGVTQVMLDTATMDDILTSSPISLSQSVVDGMTLMDKQYAIKTAIEQSTISTTDVLPAAVEDTADPVDEVHPYGTVWIASTSGNTFQTPGDGSWVQVNTP